MWVGKFYVTRFRLQFVIPAYLNVIREQLVISTGIGRFSI